MDERTADRLKSIWRQISVPVVFRKRGGDSLLVRVPFSEDNRYWLREGHRKKPVWNPTYKCWETPRSWLNDLVEKSLLRYGKVYLIQPYRKQEKCAPACWNATGHECNCSCMGEHHGESGPNGKWIVVSDTFATKWSDEREYSCRLLTRK